MEELRVHVGSTKHVGVKKCSFKTVYFPVSSKYVFLHMKLGLSVVKIVGKSI